MDGRGYEFCGYWKNIKDTISNPDYVGKSKTHNTVRIYIQKNNSRRKFLSKFLIVIANSNNDVVSAGFRSKLNFKELQEIKKGKK